MKTRHITLLASVAAAFASCAPIPDSAPTTPPTQGSEVPAPMTEIDSNVPVGRPTPDGKKDMVISPYRPYNVINVSGYQSGDIVGDPSTARIDPKTNKPIANTSKHFRIP